MTMVERAGGYEKLTETEIRTLRYWINTGALYPGTYGALGSGIVGVMTNNQADQKPVLNEQWKKASKVIKKNCMSCHSELGKDILDEENLTWWRSRVEVSSGSVDIERYKEAIRFSRHIVYNLTKPSESTILKAPLSVEAGGYGLCRDSAGKSIIKNKRDPKYLALLEAIQHSASFLQDIKRFDMEGFVVRGDYYREMVRFGVIDETTPIEEVDPYVADSIYWDQQ
jgi:hypothetical protein